MLMRWFSNGRWSAWVRVTMCDTYPDKREIHFMEPGDTDLTIVPDVEQTRFREIPQ